MGAKTKESAEQADVVGYRKSDVRYGANCPGIVELRLKDKKHYIALTGVIVNISVTGCLFSNEKTPWSRLDFDTAGKSFFNLIQEICHIYVPWTNTHRVGRIRRAGAFIVGVEFRKPIKEDLVQLIAGMEPGHSRRFRPKRTEKYNRILPLMQDEA